MRRRDLVKLIPALALLPSTASASTLEEGSPEVFELRVERTCGALTKAIERRAPRARWLVTGASPVPEDVDLDEYRRQLIRVVDDVRSHLLARHPSVVEIHVQCTDGSAHAFVHGEDAAREVLAAMDSLVDIAALDREIESTLTSPEMLEDQDRFRDLVGRSMSALDLDDSDLADKLPVSCSAVSRWRSGSTAPLPSMRKPVYQMLLRRVRQARGATA